MAITTRRKYETDRGSIFFVELDERSNVLSRAGEEPAGVPTENMTLKVTSNRKANGIKPRYALFGRAIGTPDPTPNDSGFTTTATAYKKVPLLTRAAGDELDASVGIVIGDVTFTFIKVVNEKVD